MSANPSAQDMDAGGAGAGGRTVPEKHYIDDGGAVLLPDGAIIYLTLSARPCPSDSTLRYEGFGTQFFQTYCQRCHTQAMTGMLRQGAPDGLNFDDVETIRRLQDLIWSAAADTHTIMPPTAPVPTRAERQQLGDWIACGEPSADTASAP